MRHAEVSYVDETGRPVSPEDVPLTSRGREQAEAARDALAAVELAVLGRIAAEMEYELLDLIERAHA